VLTFALMSAPIVSTEFKRDRLVVAAAYVQWWPSALTLLVIGMIYALLSDQLTLGPPWELLVVVLLTLPAARVTRWRGLWRARRYLVLGSLGIVSASVTVSAAFLVRELIARKADPIELLEDAALIWLSNVLTFALIYWEVDGGGPAHRHAAKRASTDFAFPQNVLADDPADPRGWMPDFLDYLFLAFNTSTAFSPTDTMVLARRAKALMMWQSIVSLITIVVIAARAINTI